MSEWVNVKDRLPEENGQYIVAIKETGKNGDFFIVRTVYFAKSLFNTNAIFPGWDKDAKQFFIMEADYKKRYDHPGFYYTFGYGEAEELDIGSDRMCVNYWMPLPDPPIVLKEPPIFGYSPIPQ